MAAPGKLSKVLGYDILQSIEDPILVMSAIFRMVRPARSWALFMAGPLNTRSSRCGALGCKAPQVRQIPVAGVCGGAARYSARSGPGGRWTGTDAAARACVWMRAARAPAARFVPSASCCTLCGFLRRRACDRHLRCAGGCERSPPGVKRWGAMGLGSKNTPDPVVGAVRPGCRPRG